MALSAPNSPVDIGNLSLDLLKQAPVVQLDPPSTTTEQLLARWYQPSRQAALRAHPWNFALKRITITPTGTAPVFGFTHAYDLPNDFIRFIDIKDDEGFVKRPGTYEMENNQLLLNGEDNTAINVRYVRDFTEVNKMDALFIDFFVFTLALKIGPKFTGTEARLKTIAEMQREISTEARAIDGQERPAKRVQRSKFIKARQSSQSRVAGQFTVFE